MAGKEEIKEFPDVSHKLAAPKKVSQYEKDRKEAELKRQRAEAENAAALRQFANSFGADEDDEDDALSGLSRRRPPPTGPRGAGMGSGATISGPRSGPGSLGPAPGPPPPSVASRRRAMDQMREDQEARREYETLTSERARRWPTEEVTRIKREDDDDSEHKPRPTMELSSLPLNTTEAMIRDLLQPFVQVHSVRLQREPAPGMARRPSSKLSALVTLTAEMTSAQVDLAVIALRGKYLGYGFYLSIARGLSSTAFQPSISVAATPQNSVEPFGAEMPREGVGRQSMRNAPPPRDYRGFAPPVSYEQPARPAYGMQQQQGAVVDVHAPIDLATIRAIHILAERLLTERDADRMISLEAVLMADKEVRQDERFAFLFDSRSSAGLYYRYLLWGPDDLDEVRSQKRHLKGLERVYDDRTIDWAPPYDEVPFPNLTALEQAVTDIDYISSDEDEDDYDEQDRRLNFNSNDDPFETISKATSDRKHLTPLKRAHLVHLLARLPASNTLLRKGDVARVTHFAISHAGQGADEIVNLLLLNVEKPFCYTSAAKYEDDSEEDQSPEDSEYEPGDALPSFSMHSPQPQHKNRNGSTGNRDIEDPSNAKLVALYVISDILSASSIAGAKNAWKYRQLLEAGFLAQNTFSRLGKLEKELAWGRLKSEQWKRKVGVVLGNWEGWNVFSSEVMEQIREGFESAGEPDKEDMGVAEEEERKANLKARFVKVGSAASPSTTVAEKIEEDIDGIPMEEDVDGVPMEEDIDGIPMEEDIDGVPMMEDIDGVPMVEDVDGEPMKAEVEVAPAEAPKPILPKKRMRAEDMFADSDDE